MLISTNFVKNVQKFLTANDIHINKFLLITTLILYYVYYACNMKMQFANIFHSTVHSFIKQTCRNVMKYHDNLKQWNTAAKREQQSKFNVENYFHNFSALSLAHFWALLPLVWILNWVICHVNRLSMPENWLYVFSIDFMQNPIVDLLMCFFVWAAFSRHDEKLK